MPSCFIIPASQVSRMGRASSRQHRLVYLHLVNRVIQQCQQCPTKLLDVAIALIPKSDGAQGSGAGRPISLIESLMKLATAWVAHRMKAALRAHRRETDPPEPTLPSGRLEEMQGVRGRQSGQRAAQNEQNASSNPHIDAWWASATQTAPEDAYKRLIDACRLAVEEAQEAHTSHGDAIGSYAEASGVGGAGMRFFDNFLRTASRQGLWPPWWTFADVAAVKKLTRRRASASCTRKRCRT